MATTKKQRRARYKITIMRGFKEHRSEEFEGTREEARAHAKVMKLHHSSGVREAAQIKVLEWLDADDTGQER